MDVNELKREFVKIFGDGREMVVVQAPGRVNLLGGHTDYNDGFVFPAAIEQRVIMLSSRRSDSIIRLYSLNFKNMCGFDLSRLEYDNVITWSNYERGVIKILSEKGYETGGADVLIWSNVPIGAGLSSSAAIEIASVLTFVKLFNLEITELEIIKIAQRAEVEFVGMRCGIMDQFVSLLARKDHGLFLDCRTLEYENVPINVSSGTAGVNGVSIVICNTNKKRELTESEYNLRRAQCTEAVNILKGFFPGIRSLRDVTEEQFTGVKDNLPLVLRKRAEHVICENKRVLKGMEFLKKGEIEEFGKLMIDSYSSLKELYEISCFELDTMMQIAIDHDGIIGARITGAGFGGCTVNLVRSGAVGDFKEKIMRIYSEKTGINPEVYITSPSDGGLILSG
ncbi:MAG: galactokinase [Fidelibacterota bacterium]